MARPGFYIAHHPWFDAERGSGKLFKVGHTGDLRRRLCDDAYTTCFSEGFAFRFTLETASKEDAARVEGTVLACAAAHRLRRKTGAISELVAMELADIIDLAQKLAARLGVAATPRRDPTYPPPPRRRPAEGAPRQGPPDSSLTDADAAVVATILGEQRAPLPDLDDLFDDLADGLGGLRLGGPGGATPVTGGAATAPATDTPADEGDTANPDAEFVDELLVATLEDPLGGDAPAAPLVDREYQTEATAAILRELGRNRRTILQMACRCGKTKVAHNVLADYLGRRRDARVLYLVPGLALMRQTARKLDRYGGPRARLLLVGSDTRTLEGLTTYGGEAEGAVAGTTDPEAIAAAFAREGPLVVVSTYQSSPLLPDESDLVVFDESHRICGDRRARPFTHVLLEHRRGDRLFMTATPRYDAPVSMKDRALFGGIAYVYHMRAGIDAGYVNDFSLELVGRPEVEGLAGGDATAAQVVDALRDLGAVEAPRRLLVFCRNIRHAADLRAEVEALVAGAEGLAGVACLEAHSRMHRRDVAHALATFCRRDRSAVLFNCRLFQEGVEIPHLNAIMFAAPRHSPRDIIQSLCRPLNVVEGKPPSKVYLPLAVPESGGAATEAEEVAPGELGRFASVVPYFDALIAEDPLLYEHLLDPGTDYPLRWVCGSATGGYRPRALLAAARGYVRRKGGKTERLLRAANIPWEIGFGELQRIVEECGRYPKTTDCFVYAPGAKVNFSTFYKHCQKSYLKWKAGEKQPLEPHQLRALEDLTAWETYGVEGPYPWRETLDFLEKWLRDHGGRPPPVNIQNGGYVGLDASPMERLSGTLTCINQSDGRDRKNRGKAGRNPGSGFTLSAAKQRDLDELCARWNLRWRKQRHAPPPGSPPGAVGSLVEDSKGKYIGPPTFIQEAYAAFKAEYKKNGAASEFIQKWYKGFPQRHARQEREDVWARRHEIVPPRWRRERKKRT